MLRGDADDPPMRETPMDRILTGLVPWRAHNVQEFIDRSLDSKIRLQDCATRAGLSASHSARAFKATSGTTVLDYIHGCRVERVQQMMPLSGQRLSQIALDRGFAEQAHYCRPFSRVIGVNPNAWRCQNMPEARDEESTRHGDVLKAVRRLSPDGCPHGAPST